MSNLFGSTAAGVMVLILLALLIALLVIVINLSLRMTRLQRRYRLFMRGTDGESVEKAMAGRLKELGMLRSGQERQGKDLDILHNQYDRMLCKYGIVKYDAFEDVGGKMSFALAMLDQENTGFVLNAIHSRDNCFLYLKDIVKGTSYIVLSDEEIEALRRAARSGDDAAMVDEARRKKAAARAKARAEARAQEQRKLEEKRKREEREAAAQEEESEEDRAYREQLAEIEEMIRRSREKDAMEARAAAEAAGSREEE